MSRAQQAIRDLTLVAAVLAIAIVVIAVSVGTSVDQEVTQAVHRIGESVTAAARIDD